MSPDDAKVFWKSVQCTVEKDVVRTDRSHPYFKGEDNPNIDILKSVPGSQLPYASYVFIT